MAEALMYTNHHFRVTRVTGGVLVSLKTLQYALFTPFHWYPPLFHTPPSLQLRHCNKLYKVVMVL